MQGPIVLAYSGGLDTTAILLWLKEHYAADVIAYCADLGGTDAQPEVVRNRAMELGVKEFIFEDLQQEFVDDYVFPMLGAGATYQQSYLLGTAVARPLIAKRMSLVAKKYGASAIAHGATGKGNDQIRFEKVWSQLLPDTKLIAPWKLWDYKGRSDLLAYLAEKGIPYDFPNKTFSIDENLMHVSYEGGPLEDLGTSWIDAVPHLMPQKTGSEEITIAIQNGVPVSLQTAEGQVTASVEIMAKLNSLGAAYGIGILDLVEERVNGIKSRGVYVTPAGTLLKSALDNLKQVCWDGQMSAMAAQLASTYGQIVYQGDWFAPTKVAMDKFFQSANAVVTGEVTFLLQPYSAQVVCRSSAYSLYDQTLVSFESDEFGVNAASAGFCQTLNLKPTLLGNQGHSL